jgi:serine/threonine protein kinase
MKNKIGEKEKKNEVFEKEIQFISKLRHKNIISFYGFMTEPNYGIILELCKFFFKIKQKKKINVKKKKVEMDH